MRKKSQQGRSDCTILGQCQGRILQVKVRIFLCGSEVKEKKKRLRKEWAYQGDPGGKSVKNLSGQFGSAGTERKRETAWEAINKDHLSPNSPGRLIPFSLKAERRNLVQRRGRRPGGRWDGASKPRVGNLEGRGDSCSLRHLTTVTKMDGTDRNTLRSAAEDAGAGCFFYLLREKATRAICQERGERKMG